MLKYLPYSLLPRLPPPFQTDPPPKLRLFVAKPVIALGPYNVQCRTSSPEFYVVIQKTCVHILGESESTICQVNEE